MTEHVCAEIVPIFTQLDHEELVRVSALVKHHHLTKGEIALGPNTPKQLVILAQGAAKVYQLAANGKEQLLRVLEAGDFEGEKNLFGITNQDLYVETLKNANFCVLQAQDFQPLLERYPSIAWKLLQSNANKIDALERQNQLLNHDLIEQRLATYLLDLAKVDETEQVTLPMKLKELASFLGTTPETISRKFKIFEDEQLLRRQGKTVNLLDVDGLAAVRDA
ncbi:Crp/Fnr family transcriptional regulator [Lapidilactobacillus achengensis]|uniref:Crp/Fnr family transcriptional regulator n=1 Tax=Lapidilactobacillus achengensis TaxID=2486000 RepID=A0ABW1UMQ8_9LACO|nr:Crp/Fnr family transcriptional regulator [Lapidilactobacillus achengensis]